MLLSRELWMLVTVTQTKVHASRGDENSSTYWLQRMLLSRFPLLMLLGLGRRNWGVRVRGRSGHLRLGNYDDGILHPLIRRRLWGRWGRDRPQEFLGILLIFLSSGRSGRERHVRKRLLHRGRETLTSRDNCSGAAANLILLWDRKALLLLLLLFGKIRLGYGRDRLGRNRCGDHTGRWHRWSRRRRREIGHQYRNKASR